MDFAPLSIKMGMMGELSPEDLSLSDDEGEESDDDEDDEKGGPTRETAEVWIVDVHLDGSEAGIPAIVDLGCQSSILNWKAARALGYKRAGKDTQTQTQKEGEVGEKGVEGKTRIVTPQLAGEVEGEAQGEQGIEVCFAEETHMSLGAGKIELPSRRLAIADLPVFAYAGLKKTPAMVLGLDVLGSAGDWLVLDWAERRLTLQGPLFPIKQGKASLELPLLMFDSREEEEKDTKTHAQPPFGLLRQYAVPAVLGEDQEAVLMLDTAAGATVLKSEVWEEYKVRFSARQAQQQQRGNDKNKKEEILEETIDMTGPGGSLSTDNKAKKVLLGMHIGGTESREGHAIVTHAAVLPVWGSAPKFDGVLGQSFLAEYPLVDFDLRHEMVRMYEREEREGEGEGKGEGEKGSASAAASSSSSSFSLEGRLDYWPVPGSSTPPNAAKLIVGVATDLVGPNHFLAVHVHLNTHTHTPILGLLDTGAQTSVLNWQAAKALGLEEGSKEILSSTATAVGIDGRPTKLKYASFSQVAFEGKDGSTGQHLIIPPPEGQGHTHTNIAIADMPGLAGLGLLEVPAMIVGLDLLDGGRRGRLVIDAEGGRLFVV